jgi:Ca-activated chloride channel family protein
MPTWDQPAWLGLLVVVPVFARWEQRARQRHAHDLAQFVSPTAAFTQNPTRGWPRVAAWTYGAGVVGLILALAGPRWGSNVEWTASRGRDVLVVLDLSRSMTATDVDPTRWQAARQALLGLADTLARHGGHRVGLVVFAAQARIACPLTADLHFFRSVLNQLTPATVPGELAAEVRAVSGTRIGAGVQLALSLLDTDDGARGYTDVLVLTDGDDPANDQEWRQASRAAQAVGVPIQVVGLGEVDPPAGKWPVPGMQRQGQPVLTRQVLPVTQGLARATGGQYLAAERSVPDLGQFFRTHLEPQGDRDRAGEPLLTTQSRQTEVLFGVVVCWLIAAWVQVRLVPDAAAR